MSRFLNENKFEHHCENGSIFLSDRCDFKNGVTVKVPDNLSETRLAQNISEMIGYHAYAILPELNGFNGYKFIEYQIIRNTKSKKLSPAHSRDIVSDCENNWGVVAKILLETPGWPQGELETMVAYQRYDDDTKKGSIGVQFSLDGDGWIQVISEKDPDEFSLSHRFRMPIIGGGQSARTRQALLLLALAIKLDNEEKFQQR